MSLLAKDGAAARMQYKYRTSKTLNMPVVRLDRAELALALEAERLYGVRYRSPECRRDPEPVDAQGSIVCSYRMDNSLRHLLGYPPVTSSSSIGVRGHRIIYLSFPWLNVSYPVAAPVEFARFVRWLDAEHPEAGQPYEDGELFTTMGQELTHILTRRSINLLAAYLEEYERSFAD